MRRDVIARWLRGGCCAAGCLFGGSPCNGGEVGQPAVTDVAAAFAAINDHGSRFGAWTHDILPWPSYALTRAHSPGPNHFQGLQRLARGRYMVVVGSDVGWLAGPDATRFDLSGWQRLKEPHGDLLIMEIGTAADADGPLGLKALDPNDLPRAANRGIARAVIDLPKAGGTPLWHPGGIAVVGDLLLVPVENYLEMFGPNRSRLLFYDLSEPARPRRMPVTIDRAAGRFQDKAGAAAFNQLPDGRWLVLARSSRELSFHVSHTRTLSDGFPAVPLVVWDEERAEAAAGVERVKFSGASFQIVRQSDGALYIISFGRRARPASEHEYAAFLWTLEFPGGVDAAAPRVVLQTVRTFTAPELGRYGWGEFSAAAGVHVTRDGRLAIYAAPRWVVTAVGATTLEAVMAGAGKEVRPGERVFLPMLEFWPREP
jgi:hypothetical protein